MDDRYRPNVGIVLANPAGMVFWAKRRGRPWWQFPQGGIRAGENPRQAMLRELGEETGLAPDKVRFLAQTREWLRYDIPDGLRRGRWRGQKQLWFLLRFAGADSDINLNAAAHPEFDEWRWLHPNAAAAGAAPFKRDIYRAVLAEFQKFLA